VVDSFPAALRIDSYDTKRRNAFATVVDSYNCPNSNEHKDIVENIMQHANIEDDIYGIISESIGMTLLEYARYKENNVVFEFFKTHFGIHENK